MDMLNAYGRCTVAEAAEGHSGLVQQQCSYELQHFTALKYVISVAETGYGAMAAVITTPPPQETSSSNAVWQRQEWNGAAVGGQKVGAAEVGTCTTLDQHEVSAIGLASHTQHPAGYQPLRCLSRLPSPHAAVFIPASAKTPITRAFRRRHRRARRKCAAQTVSQQTLDVLSACARRMVSCSAEQTAALEQPVSFSADQLLALNLPALAHKRGGAHMRRLALRERMRAQAPRLQAAARRWLARRRLDRLRADRERTERRRVQQEAHEAAAQLALQILQTAEPCPPYPTVDSLSEWAVSVEAWLNGAGLGAAITQTSITSSLSTLSFETQLACRSLSLKLQQALGYFKLGVLKTVAQKWGPGNGMHGGRLWEAVMGGIKTPAATEHRPPWRRAQWSNGRGRGRQVPRQSGTL
mmetsp:Transcript_61058/g.101520  ORF Transcript_61058/g.101520 Transcript_61058/m.101520 type:complete len:411 (+) Transcript_61058:178-1410(+)